MGNSACCANDAGGDEIKVVDKDKSSPMTAAPQETVPQAKDPGLSVKVQMVSAAGLRNVDTDGTLSDPFCTVQLTGKPSTMARTKTVDDRLDPEWNTEVVLNGYDYGDSLEFVVWDKDENKADDLLGKATLEGVRFTSGFSGEIPLTQSQSNSNPVIRVMVAIGNADYPPMPALAKREKAQAPTVVSQPSNVYTVTVTKMSSSDKIGLDISHQGGRALKVKKVKEGLIDKWNKENPDKFVKDRDIITKVNGEEGDCAALMAMLAKNSTLTLTLQRPE